VGCGCAIRVCARSRRGNTPDCIRSNHATYVHPPEKVMSVLTIVLIAVAVVIAAILAIAAAKSDLFEVKRSASINVPSDRVHPLINDLRAQMRWSPFEKDPNMKRVHSGPAQGTGAVYEWDGNRDVGAGRVAITDSTPSTVKMNLQMTRPFACNNEVEFTLQPNGQGTDVTWAMRGTRPFMMKVMSTFIDCEKMVCKQFDQGLAKLKTLAEA
jgi:hypothetical protein